MRRAAGRDLWGTMMNRLAIALLIAVWGLMGLAGCTQSQAEVRTDHPPLGHTAWQTDRTAYQYSAGRIIEIVIERRWVRPRADQPDYEYIHMTVPDRRGLHTVADGTVRAERLVRVGQEEFLYRAVAGSVDYRFSVPTGEHAHATFDLEMQLVWPTELAGSRWHLRGTATSREDVSLAQGLVNRYGGRVKQLSLAAAPRPTAKVAAPK